MEENLPELIANLGSHDIKIRTDAARTLARMGEAAVPHLVAALPDDSLHLESLFKILRDIGEPTVLPLIAALADNSNAKTQQRAVHVLGQINDPRVIEPLIAALHDDDAPVREEAVIALRTLGDGRAIMPLLDILKTGDVGIRSKIAWALGDFGTAKVVDGLVTAFQTDTEPQVRRGAIWSLGKLQDERIAPLLEQALKDDDKEVSHLASVAVDKLKHIGESESIEGYVTREVANVIGRDGRPVEDITSIDSMRHSNPQVRVKVIQLIIQRGGAQNVGLLLTALDDINAGVRNSVVEALVNIGAPAVDPLIKTLGSANRIIRAEAARALGMIGDTRAVDPLIETLKDGQMQVRLQAAESLAKIGDDRAVRPLIDAMMTLDASEPAIEAALIKLGEDPNSMSFRSRKLLARGRAWLDSRNREKK